MKQLTIILLLIAFSTNAQTMHLSERNVIIPKHPKHIVMNFNDNIFYCWVYKKPRIFNFLHKKDSRKIHVPCTSTPIQSQYHPTTQTNNTNTIIKKEN